MEPALKYLRKKMIQNWEIIRRTNFYGSENFIVKGCRISNRRIFYLSNFCIFTVALIPFKLIKIQTSSASISSGISLAGVIIVPDANS